MNFLYLIVFSQRGVVMALRAVAPDEKAPTKPKTVTVAAASGSRRDLLVAMRSRIAVAVEDQSTPARDLAALTRRLELIAKEIEAIDVAEAEEGAESGPTPDEDWDASAI